MTGKRFKSSKLITAIRDGRLNAVIDALNDGCDIEEADMHGQPGLPLRTACFSGNLAIVRELLAQGANINASGSDGPSAPLRLAVRCRHQSIVSLLIKQGANIPEGLQIDTALLSEVDALDVAPLELATPTLPQAPAKAPPPSPAAKPAPTASELALEPIGELGNIVQDFEAPASFGTATTLLSMEMLRLGEEEAIAPPPPPPAAIPQAMGKPAGNYAPEPHGLALEPLDEIGSTFETFEAPANFGTATTLLSMEMLRLSENEEETPEARKEQANAGKPGAEPLDFTL